MHGYTIEAGGNLDKAEVLALYDAVGWSAYTRDGEVLLRALAGSHTVLTARDGAGALVGLARTVSDGETICYLQDILVHPEHQRRGLGRQLMAHLLDRYAHVRQRVLLTDDEPGQRAFYEECGFTDSVQHEHGPLHAFVLFR